MAVAEAEKLGKILIVDDDRDFLKSCVAAVEEEFGVEYDVLRARDGKEALEIYDKHKLAMVVLDLMLPKRGGWSVLQRIKPRGASEKNEEPYVIMVTANEGRRHQLFAEQKGVEAYLIKPFRMESLVSEMRRWLDK